MANFDEIKKFMRDNEEFLSELKKTTGKTNLGEFFDQFLRQK